MMRKDKQAMDGEMSGDEDEQDELLDSDGGVDATKGKSTQDGE